MKRRPGILLFALTAILIVSSLSFFGCSEEQEYSLSVTGSELLYEELKDGYKAGEKVTVKVKITPHVNTVAYLDLLPLTRTKNSQDDYLTFTFTMPDKSAVLNIENKTGFEEDLLTGFHLTFSKNGNPIENLNKELKSSEAVAAYYYSYFDEEIGRDVFTRNDGADVFADGKSRHGSNVGYGFSDFELEETLYFTYELLDAVAGVDWVYFNPQTNGLRTTQSAGFALDAISIATTHNIQNLSDPRYNGNGEEYEITFDSEVAINFQYIDYLTGVKILEYDKNHQLIKTSDFTGKNRSEIFTVSDACEYAVIEEEYTVMSGEQKDEKRYERTLIDKTAHGDGKTLKYPRGDGLIAPVYLSVEWQVA